MNDFTMLKKIVLAVLFISTAITSFAEPDPALLDNPWAVFVYAGQMTENTIGKVVAFNFQLDDETLYSLELSRQLSPNNPFRRWLQPIVGTIELNANGTYRDDPVGPIYEFNPYVSFRWIDFPWNHVITTTFAIGEGLSYDTNIPQVEAENSEETQNLLNYLMLEATFALPKYPRWELVYRIHHRSGVFGLYNAGNNGSTAVGLGIRYRF